MSFPPERRSGDPERHDIQQWIFVCIFGHCGRSGTVVSASGVVCGIAAQSRYGYNGKPRKSDSQVLMPRVLSSGLEYKKMGNCPFFFW
jgi:hypothetical protein